MSAGLDESTKTNCQCKNWGTKTCPLDDDDKAFFTKRANEREASNDALYDGLQRQEDLKEKCKSKVSSRWKTYWRRSWNSSIIILWIPVSIKLLL